MISECREGFGCRAEGGGSGVLEWELCCDYALGGGTGHLVVLSGLNPALAAGDAEQCAAACWAPSPSLS